MNTQIIPKTWLIVVMALFIIVGEPRANADFTFGTSIKVPNVNSTCVDCQPDISADGLSLYFASSRPHEIGFSYFNIWMATRETTDDDWNTPVKLGPPVNSGNCEAEPSISADGLELYFCDGVMGERWYTRPGGYGDIDIWVSTRATTNDPWGEPKNLGPIVNSSVYEGDPEISADGLSLFLHSHRPGGYGQCELYVSTRATVSDSWGPLVNLAPPVNSSVMEIDPSISADGLMLFFCSNRVGGYGNGDIWMTRRSNTSDSWGPPLNLGPAVNTSMSEADPSISADGRILYFICGPGNVAGPWDVWQVPIVPITDLNGDGIVDSVDMCIIIDNWGTDSSLCDIGPMPWGDGIVDVQDLVILAEHLFEEILPIELIAYWKLDEAEGDIAYNSIGDNHGILNGNPTWQPDGGQIAGALEFDGIDDYIATDFVLNPADGPFSLFAWIKGGAPGQVIISQIDDIEMGDTWLGITALDGSLMTGLVPPPIGRFLPQPLESQSVVTDGQWHHVGFVWDGSYRSLYVDGIEVVKDTNILIQPLMSSNGDLYIGTSKNLEAGTFFSGLIDDVRIYDKTLTAEQIQTMAQ